MAADYLSMLRAHLGSVTTVPASEAKNQFGQVLDSALRDGAVVITKHDTPKAILISIEEFEAMTVPRHALDQLTAHCDALLAKMQTPEHRAAVTAMFNATPEELGAAAVAEFRKRR